MKSLICCFATSVSLVGALHAGVYITNFDNFGTFPYGDDLAGNDGWQIDGASSSGGPSLITDSGFATVPSVTSGVQGISFGFEEISGSSAYLYRNSGDSLVGNTLGYTEFQVVFRILDSTPLIPNRDVFGFAFRGSGGEDILTVRMLPTQQTATPQASTRVDQMTWSSDYSTADDPNPNPPNLGTLAETAPGTTLNVLFQPSGANDVLFTIKTQNVTVASGVLNGLGSATLSTFGAIWEPLDPTNGNEGANQLVFDDLYLVPEPSSALLLGVAGLGLALRRRRA